MVFSFARKRKNICAERVRSEGARFARNLFTITRLKVFCELFFKKAKIFIFVTSQINQNLKYLKNEREV